MGECKVQTTRLVQLLVESNMRLSRATVIQAIPSCKELQKGEGQKGLPTAQKIKK